MSDVITGSKLSASAPAPANPMPDAEETAQPSNTPDIMHTSKRKQKVWVGETWDCYYNDEYSTDHITKKTKTKQKEKRERDWESTVTPVQTAR